jgi:hypothetical protein
MSGFYFFKFLKVIFLLSPFGKLHHSLFCLSILFLTFLSRAIFQMHLRPPLHFSLRSLFLIHKQQHSKYNFLCFFFISKQRLLIFCCQSLIQVFWPSVTVPDWSGWDCVAGKSSSSTCLLLFRSLAAQLCFSFKCDQSLLSFMEWECSAII